MIDIWAKLVDLSTSSFLTFKASNHTILPANQISSPSTFEVKAKKTQHYPSSSSSSSNTHISLPFPSTTPTLFHFNISMTMEIIQTPPNNGNRPPKDYHSNVDTSRPFSSVKEAVAIFGERFLTPEVYSPKPFSFPKQERTNFSSSPSWKCLSPSASPPHPSNNSTLVDTLKKLENELEETKEELRLLKERESENEVALASLNAELHKNMSKIAQAEAAAAGKAAVEEEGRKRDLIVRMESSPTLAQILSFSQEKEGGGFGSGKKRERKNVIGRKKKPIIPLLGDLFWKKKGSPTTLHNPLFSSP